MGELNGKSIEELAGLALEQLSLPAKAQVYSTLALVQAIRDLKVPDEEPQDGTDILVTFKDVLYALNLIMDELWRDDVPAEIRRRMSDRIEALKSELLSKEVLLRDVRVE